MYDKFLTRSSTPVFAVADMEAYMTCLQQLYETAAGASYVRDMSINTILSALLEKVMEDFWAYKRSES